jgi:hypothetical protein
MKKLEGFFALLGVCGILFALAAAEQPAVPTVQPVKATKYAAWNFSPTAALPGVRSLPQIRFNKWGASPEGWHWQHIHHEFLVDGRPATPEAFVRRMSDVGAFELVEAWHWLNVQGAPADDFGTEANAKVLAVLRAAVEEINAHRRGIISNTRWKSGILCLTDYETWAPVDSRGQAMGPGGGTHAGHACAYTALCLRQVGFSGPVANYATIPLDAPEVGKPAQTRAAGLQVSCLSGYIQGGPTGCYSYDDVSAAFKRASPGFVYVHDDYNDQRLVQEAEAAGAGFVVFWPSRSGERADALQKDAALKQAMGN